MDQWKSGIRSCSLPALVVNVNQIDGMNKIFSGLNKVLSILNILKRILLIMSISAN